tara:strand:+ start:2258 stop:2599 length:342 start_codon:yes stop_codon:yes gene_type:complete
MAEQFYTIQADIGTTSDDGVSNAIHTNSTSNRQIIILCQVANVHGTNNGVLNMDVLDHSASTAKALVSTLIVPADTAVNPIGGKLVLEPNDAIRAWADAASVLEVNISYLEIS